MRCGLLALSLAQASSTVDWATFLQRHDAEWEWRTATEGSMIAVADSRFAHCGEAGCCVVAAQGGAVELGVCDADEHTPGSHARRIRALQSPIRGA